MEALKMERRMAALFLLALALIAWQALRTNPVLQPDFEIATVDGEQLAPVAVPSWHEPAGLPREIPERLALLTERALAWPATGQQEDRVRDCQVFVRFSSQHWALRSVSSPQLERWLGRQPGDPAKPWSLLHWTAASFLDDDDGDGDPLDAGELLARGPGAEVEAFCGVTQPSGGSR